ncbi:hypothetical protein [Streptomyces sp. KR80]|uniref:hypothetical protein n=1 Tax=Streptomyces sp. KR80 TaxID=3457426 RepID=UPI003FCF8FE7
MRLKRKLAFVAIATALAGVAATGIANATTEDMSGTVYDDGWAHYSTKRCVPSSHGVVYFQMSSYPDGDDMRHKPTSGSGGGGITYSDQYFTAGTYAWRNMGVNSGKCFYWNARQYEGTFETDWQDTWFAHIDWRNL